jgi:hypothetical protein
VLDFSSEALTNRLDAANAKPIIAFIGGPFLIRLSILSVAMPIKVEHLTIEGC